MQRLRLLLLFATMLFSLATTAQQITSGNPENRWKWGINYGMSWQTADVKSRLGWGIGSTLEFAFLENDHSLFGLSLRGRYLFTENWGRDMRQFSGIDNNNALNGVNNPSVDYTSTTGYVYQNFYTNTHDLDLELMLTLNRLRARSGILIYVFGGVGGLGHRARLDQLDLSGSMYDYSTIGSGSSIFSPKKQLDLMRDNRYETFAEGSEYQRNWNFAPSLGAGYGVRLGRNVYMGIEYKLTFPRTDLLDGQRWNNDNTLSSTRDLHHYASGFIRLGLWGHGGGHVTYTNEGPKPVITVLDPTTTDVTSCDVYVRAKVDYVNSASGITVQVNGSTLASNQYYFDPQSGNLEIYRQTYSGRNNNITVVIIARNANGERSAYVSFYCNNVPQPVVLPPTIVITQPTTNPFPVADCNNGYVQAQVQNATREQITVKRDGVPLSSSQFSFNENNGTLSFSVKVINNTTVTIEAVNQAGNATASVTLSCNIAPPRPLPTVNITRPALPNYTTSNCNEQVTATVLNVDSKNDINVQVNGVYLPPAQFTYDNISHIVRFYVAIPGNAQVIITATNSAGSASDQTMMTCVQQIPTNPTPPVVYPPAVNIIQPAGTPYNSMSCREDIVAIVSNVSSKNNIRVTVNNSTLAASAYTFDPNSGRLFFTQSFSGNTAIVISATNTAGSASDNTMLVCSPAPSVTPPSVTIVQPAGRPYTSVSCQESIVAIVNGVSEKNNIRVTVNNTLLSPSAYIFEPASGRITFTQNISGSATIVITATNSAGSASDNTTINCSPAPAVTITYPATELYSSLTCRETVIATVRNVPGKQYLEVTVNGQVLAQSLYEYNAQTGILSLPVSINKQSDIIIRAATNSGSAMDNVTIACNPPVTPKPVVKIVTPVANVYVSATCDDEITATVLNVSGKENIVVKNYNQVIAPALYNYDINSKLLTYRHKATGVSRIIITAYNNQGAMSDSVDIQCKPAIPTPTVTITSPSGNPFISVTCKETITALLKNVPSKAQIKVKANGQELAAEMFDYNTTSGILTLSSTISGETNYSITATTEGGTATASVTIKCSPPAKPEVTITTPATNPATSVDCKEEIKATVKNVKSKNQITVTVNNEALSPDLFTFDPASGIVALTRTIKEPITVVITATTDGGVASDNITIICKPPVVPPGPKPTVVITQPSGTPYVSVTCDDVIKATVQNVKAKENIIVTVNNQLIESANYSYDAATQILAYAYKNTGISVIVISAFNDQGSASATLTIQCKPPVPAPTVNISTPATTPFVSTACKETISATLMNVPAIENISVTLNGQELPASLLSYNVSTRILTFNISIPNEAVVKITATTEGGTATDNVTILCKPPVPGVTITTPANTPYASVNCHEKVIAKLQNATSKDQITVYKDGIAVAPDGFIFNASAGTVELTTDIPNRTTVMIKLQTQGGIAKDSVQLVCAPPKPSVNITTPSGSPYTSVSCKERVTATVQNVGSKEEVTVRINGAAMPRENFSYTATTKTVTFETEITNRVLVIVEVSNKGGSALDSISIVCTPPKPKPTVNITTPSQNPFTSKDCSEKVIARVTNVESKAQITVTKNGSPVADFSFSNGSVEWNAVFEGTVKYIVKATNESGSDADTVTLVCAPPPPKPTVNITVPSGNPVTSKDCSEKVTAVVTNVNSKSQISVTKNGSTVSDFTYNNGTVDFNANFEGTVKYIVKATNESGWDADTVTLVCTPPKPKPTVNITVPSGNPVTSQDCNEKVVAVVTNVELKSQITVTRNGNAVSDFNFSNGIVDFNASFEGTVKFIVKATNESGWDADTITLVCTPPPPKPTPTVNITTPSGNPVTSVDCNEKVTATVTGIDSKSQITITKNGATLSDFNYYNGTVEFTSAIQGTIKFIVKATNESGWDADTVSITCTPPKPTPTINITTPSGNPVTSVDCNEKVTARVTGIDSKSQITITKNGATLSDFNYYNGTVEFTSAIQGTIKFIVKATNESGWDADTVSITCAPPKPTPTVNITTPSGNPVTSVDCNEKVTARVTGIDSKSQITITKNGATLSDFNYYNGTVEFTSAIQGTIKFIVKATNESGWDADTVSITCTPPAKPPVVTITSQTDKGGHVCRGCNEKVVATVLNVTSKSQITVTKNGNPVSTFNFINNTVDATFAFEGTIKVIIKATNEAGWDADTVILVCEPQTPIKPKPTVNITTPSADPFTSDDCSEKITAKITNVDSKSQIQVTKNGSSVSEFSYYNGIVEFNTTFQGTAKYIIKATNDAGWDADTINLVCSPPAPKPTVSITSPSGNPYVSTTCKETVQATVKNVSGVNDISVKVGSRTLSASEISYNASSGAVSFSTGDYTGDVQVTITATNAVGSASATLSLQCKKPTTNNPVISENCSQNLSGSAGTLGCSSGNCTRTITGSSVEDLNIGPGEKICITGTYAGNLTMNGGMLSICGAINPRNVAFNSGAIIVTGSATFNNMDMNDANSVIVVYGSLFINGGTVKGRIENHGSFATTAHLNINSGGVFKNYGTLTINQSMNNSSIFCNKGTLTIEGDFNNNGGAALYNHCKLIVKGNFINNSTFENNASIEVKGSSTFNSGKTTMSAGSRFITNNLTVNTAIAGGSTCAAIVVKNETRLNGGASFSGKIDICDYNGIETNNMSNKASITECECDLPEKGECYIKTDLGGQKVEICHIPPGNPNNRHVIKVPQSAVQAHLNHGDVIGACENTHDNGNGNGNGNGNREGNEVTPEKQEPQSPVNTPSTNPNQSSPRMGNPDTNDNDNNNNNQGQPNLPSPRIQIPGTDKPIQIPREINLPGR